MEIVIKLSEEDYKSVLTSIDMFEANNWRSVSLWDVIAKGIPLPKKHGRLIDVDNLREDFKSSRKISFADRMDISCIIDHAPTIIEGSDYEIASWIIDKEEE